MIGRLPAIVSLSLTDVLAAMQEWIDPVLDRSALEAYVSSVDWSNAERADPAVRLVLGEVEWLTHAAAEGEIGEAELARRLHSVLAGQAFSR